jgi:hypothetical protein
MGLLPAGSGPRPAPHGIGDRLGLSAGGDLRKVFAVFTDTGSATG